MNFEQYAKKWERDENNNFAVACYNDNSIAELTSALSDRPDKTDCKNWNITPDEWIDAIKTALNELNGEK